MIVHAHILAYNEEKLLPFTLDYYSNFCEKIFIYDNMSTDSSDEIYKNYSKVEVLKWNSNNEINEMNYINIKSNEYKKRSRGQNVDWVITCDCDEFIYHPDLINKLNEYKSKGVTVIRTSGHEMVSEFFPKYDGKLLTDKIKIGSEKLKHLSKSIIFNPEINISFDVGAHLFSSDKTILSDTDEIKILHYKFLGKEYVTEIYNQRFSRLSELNKQRQWGIHYNKLNEVYVLMDDILKKNLYVV